MLAADLWRATLQPATECAGRRCVVTQGRLPDELRGTLFRIGSGDSAPYDHWFDGDGCAGGVYGVVMESMMSAVSMVLVVLMVYI